MLIDTKCWLSEFLVHSIEAIRSLARRASESILHESCALPRKRRPSSERNNASRRSVGFADSAIVTANAGPSTDQGRSQ